jgi:hypothetical protein
LLYRVKQHFLISAAAQTLSLVDLRDLSEDAAHKNLCRMVAMAMESILKSPFWLVTPTSTDSAGVCMSADGAPLRLICCPILGQAGSPMARSQLRVPSPRGVFVGDGRGVSARRIFSQHAGRLHLTRALDGLTLHTRRKVGRSKSRRNDGGGMISRFLSLGSGFGFLLLFAGCALMPPDVERAMCLSHRT